MKSFFTCIAAFLIAICVCAQDHKLDSLDNLLAKTASDTARINLMVAKAKVYNENNLDSAIAIAQAAIAKASQIHYQKGEADAYQILGFALTYKGSFVQAAVNYKVAEGLYKQADDSEGLNNLYSGYGMYYGMQSKYDSSIHFFQKNIAYYERTRNIVKLTPAYQNIAISYTMTGNYQPALVYQNKALKLAESRKDTSDLAYITGNMAISYSNVEDYVKCEELNLKAIGYARQVHIKYVELYCYANLASNSAVLKKYGEAYEYAMKAVALGKELGDYGIVASSLSRAAMVLAFQKRFAEAEPLAWRAITIADSIGAPLNIFQTYVDMGSVKKEQQQYAAAIKYYEKGFASLNETDIYDAQISSNYQDLSEAYEKEGLYDKALTAYKTSVKINDSINSRLNIRRTTEQGMRYDFEKTQQVAKAEQDKKNAATAARQLALLIGLGCAFLLVIGAWYAYRNKQKAAALLQSQKGELQTTLDKLNTTQAQLIQSEKMASLGELTAGIAHEIQNPLNFVNNFSEVNSELISDLVDQMEKKNYGEARLIANDIKDNEERITHHGKRADAIVKSMLQHSRIATAEKIPTDINALADEYLRLSYQAMRSKDKSFQAMTETNFDENVGKVPIVPQDIGRVLLNLFQNAFYAVAEKNRRLNGTFEPTVSVTTKLRGGNVEITVKDNGSGIPQSIIHKIFQPFFTTKPTGEGTGLGLSLSYDIITKEHNGTIKVESTTAAEKKGIEDTHEQNTGTVFTLLLPLT